MTDQHPSPQAPARRAPAPPAPAGRLERLALAGVLLAAALLYAPALGHPFVYDDTQLIVGNPAVHEWSGLRAAWTDNYWAVEGWKGAGRYYRPLATSALVLGWQAFGDRPAGWHAVSLLLHLLATALVWACGRRLGLARWAAVGGAALFALHPVQIQAVAWISGFVDPLAAVLVLLSLWILLARPPTLVTAALASLPWLAALLVLDRALAALALPALVALAGAGPRFDGATRRGIADRARRAALWTAAWLPALAIWLVLRAVALGSPLPAGAGASLTLGLTRLPWAIAQTLAHLIAPLRLAIVYPGPDPAGSPLLTTALPAAVACAALAAAVWLSRRDPARPLLLAGACVLAALPLALAAVPGEEAVQDRYLYLPLALLAPWIASVVLPAATGAQADLRGAIPRRAAFTLALLALVALHPANRTPWRSAIDLYERALQVTPDHPRSAMNLSNARRAAGQGDPDCALLRGALAAVDEGRHAGDPVLLHYNLGNCLRAAGDHVAAAEHYGAAVDHSGGAFPHARHNLVVALLELGRDEEAWRHAGALIDEAPGEAGSWRLRGEANLRLDRREQAANCFERALAIEPADAHTRARLDALR